MKVLGIYDGHNAAVAMLTDGKIDAVIEEERLSRIKFHDGRFDGMPYRSLAEVLRISGTSADEIDHVAIPLLSPAELSLRVARNLIIEGNPNWIFFFLKNFGKWGPLYHFSPATYQMQRKKNILKFLNEHGLGGKKIFWTEHHMAHNASAYYTSNVKGDALAICFDGKGDGLCGQVAKCRDGQMQTIHSTPEYHSIAMIYSVITEYLGFRPMRHEGKITGLAAYAPWDNKAYGIMKNYAGFDGENVKAGLFSDLALRPYPWLSTKDVLPKIKYDFDGKGFTREELSSAVQKLSEDIAVQFVSHWVKKTGFGKVVLSGGLFSNVKINKAIMEIPEVESVFIHPAMGDGGLALGAAFLCEAHHAGLEPFELENVYFGTGYSDKEIEGELSKFEGLEFKKSGNIVKETSDLIVEGKVVARFGGRMEYGPRALGNRSILYDPSDPSVNKWLNDRLRRSEFMPFAPSALEESAHELYVNPDKALYAARFMTIAFETTKFGSKAAPANTHVDNTARPQLVSAKYNETYYKILKGFAQKSGVPCFVNTSFNMHEEPIVGSPNDAIRSFSEGGLDVLSIGNYIAVLKEPAGKRGQKK